MDSELVKAGGAHCLRQLRKLLIMPTTPTLQSHNCGRFSAIATCIADPRVRLEHEVFRFARVAAQRTTSELRGTHDKHCS